MRTAFIEQLTEEAKSNDKIFLIVGDLGFSVVEKFAGQFPERFLNAGIAEQNMIGVAAGLAKEGYNVYVYSIGNFPTLRCMEQIRYDVAYHNSNVKIVSVGAGFAYGTLGTSHYATEDIGMMRTIPNMVVCSPCDPIEAKNITKLSANYNGPMYLRLGKSGEKTIHSENLHTIEIGDILNIKKGEDIAVLSTGSIVYEIYENIKKGNNNAALFSCPFIKPLDKNKLRNILLRYNKIITVEEHQASAGFGSAIVEIASDFFNDGELIRYPNIKRIAIPDIFLNTSGSQTYLRNITNLTISISMSLS
jgi:transketolase